MQYTLHQWDALAPIIDSPCLRQSVISGDHVMLAHARRRHGCEVALHSHANEQMTCVLEGRLQFWLGANGEHHVIVNPGEVLHIPAHVPHRAMCLEDTLELNVFSPPREEWRR